MMCAAGDVRTTVTGSLNFPFWSRHANKLSLKQITMLISITHADLVRQ